LLIPLYIDPATTSYIVQVVAGLVITLSVAAGVLASRVQMSAVTLRARVEALFARIRRSSSSSVDSTSESEAAAAVDGTYLETDYIEPGVDDCPIERPGVVTDRPKRTNTTDATGASASPPGYRLRQRAIMAAPVAVGIPFTLMVFGMVDLAIHNNAMLPFLLSEVLNTIVIASAVVCVALFVALLLLRDLAFDVFLSLGVGGLIAVYVQGNFLNTGLGLLTGDRVDWDAMRSDMIVNVALWGAIVLAPLLLRVLAKKVWVKVCVFVPLLLIGMQAVALVVSATSTSMPTDHPHTSILSTKGLYEVSPSKNVIVIVLDRLDDDFIQEVLGDDPQFFDGHFNDFTRFTNNMGVYSRTWPAVVNMLTGETYEFDRPGRAWTSDAWQHGKFLADIEDAGWSTYMFGEQGYIYWDASDLAGKVANVAPTDNRELDQTIAFRQLLKLSLFRHAPLVAKPRLHMATSAFEAAVNVEPEDGVTKYRSADHPMHAQLMNAGLSLERSNKSRFTYIHLDGTHEPFTWGPHMEQIDESQGNQLWQTRAAFNIVFDYLESLKHLGTYDDATIIVTGDHGWSHDEDLTEPVTVGLFVKPAGTSSSGHRMATNNAPTTPANLRATVISAVGLDNMALGYGPTYFQAKLNMNSVRIFNQRSGYWGGTIPETLIYEVRGDAKYWQNWRLLERVPNVYDEYS
jgi:hypothetical protein